MRRNYFGGGRAAGNYESQRGNFSVSFATKKVSGEIQNRAGKLFPERPGVRRNVPAREPAREWFSLAQLGSASGSVWLSLVPRRNLARFGLGRQAVTGAVWLSLAQQVLRAPGRSREAYRMFAFPSPRIGPSWLSLAQLGPARLSSAQLGSAGFRRPDQRPGAAWLSLAQLGSAWFHAPRQVA